MKSWKEVAHLFVGRFRVEHDNFLDHHPEIEGIDGKYIIAERLSCKIDDCTLIARPISDMSDEEKESHRMENYFDSQYRGYKESPESFLYLLSIGVYPFNQDNPKDVIWRYENDSNS